MSYGAYPKKISQSIKCSLEEATEIFNRYHNELYPSVSKMRDTVYEIAKTNKQVYLGLGWYIHTDNPDRDIRSYFNACSQYWSILTLLSINKLHSIIDKEGIEGIEVIATIYDAIYFHVREDSKLIKWLNDTIIKILTKDYLIDTIVHNEAELDIGYTWYDTITLNNYCNTEEIEEKMKKAKEMVL